MKENKNEPAYPTVYDAQNRPTHITEPGLTKLELISAMCLQGIIGSEDNFGVTTRCEAAIEHAKELLKQLEAENDNADKGVAR
jgi:hypothetical protein